jgi:hypothetical protein
MNLGNEAIKLCESLVTNRSIISLHLSHNRLDAAAIGQIKWFLSIGIPEAELLG